VSGSIIGIERLDDLFKGGVEPKSILLLTTPGINNTVFAQQAVHNSLEKGHKVLYVVTNKLPKSVIIEFQEYGWDITIPVKIGKINFLDVYSSTLGLESSAQYTVQNPKDMNKIIEKHDEMCQSQEDNKLLVVDSLNRLLDMSFEIDEIVHMITSWTHKDKTTNTTSLWMFTDWAYERKEIRIIKNCFDYVIKFEAEDQNTLLKPYCKVEQSKNTEKRVYFKVKKPGGVSICS